MNRTRWKRIGLGVGAAAAGVVALVISLTYGGTNVFPNANKQHAMLRLEDVGPGGEYGSLEGLGKLRAVLEYIQSEGIPYHVAVIPRRAALGPDGAWTERGIDDPSPDAVVQGFVRLLQDAQENGGVLGMHGYTHQYGDVWREDGGHVSGTGSEFKVTGAPETYEAEYAAHRIKSSLAAFERAGLQPAFWESPHYKDTREQEKVFRSFIGIVYQPDLFSLRSLKDLNVYETRNTYGQDTLGSVYVPAPFKYVSDGSSVDRMLEKAKDDGGLASLYFHPFKEFPFLAPAIGPDGTHETRDGLPVYRYGENASDSYLRRLANGFRHAGYRWMSLHEVVPYTPAHRVSLPASKAAHDVLLGDVTGDGHADAIVREAHRITVVRGNYAWPRNRTQAAAEVWLKAAFAPEEQLLLFDPNGDGKQDLLAYDGRTGAVRVAWAGERAFQPPAAYGALPAGLASLQPFLFGQEGGTGLLATQNGQLRLFRQEGDGWAVAAEADTPLPGDATVFGALLEADAPGGVVFGSAEELYVQRLQADGGFAKPSRLEGVDGQAGDQLLLGDADGDGRTDAIAYSAASGLWTVYGNEGGGRFRRLANDFGPWARGHGRVGVVADFDGNGKDDIASYDNNDRVLDLALSFR